MGQVTNLSGSGNVIVQIQGDGNSIVAGLPHLELTRRDGLSRRIQNETDIIRPFTRSIPMVGRETELGNLRAWLFKNSAVSVRVLTGSAGCGKTRLALELVEEMVPQGWRAGFLTRAELKRFRNQQNLAAWAWKAPVLAVVDYASVVARDLHAWLKELADNAVWKNAKAGSERPLRLLLLERQAEHGTGWWAEVFGLGDDAVVLEKMADPAEAVPLRSLNDLSQRRIILQHTLERLGSSVKLPAPEANPDFDRRLTELTWGGVPLLLMIAAVTAAREGFGQVLALDAKKLAFSVAETELDRILRVVESHNVSTSLRPLVKHVAAIVTLRQGLTAETASRMIAKESEELGYNLPNGSAALCDALTAALSNEEGGVAAVEPDMIGEALLLHVWQNNPRALPAIARAHEADPDTVAETVIRTCQDFVIRDYRDPLTWLDKIRINSTDLYALRKLSSMIPKDTLELREIAFELHMAVVNQLINLPKIVAISGNPRYADTP